MTSLDLPKGTRVRMTEKLENKLFKVRTGIIDGISDIPHQILVLRDNTTQVHYWHHSYWELDPNPPKESTYRVPVDKFPPQKLSK